MSLSHNKMNESNENIIIYLSDALPFEAHLPIEF